MGILGTLGVEIFARPSETHWVYYWCKLTKVPLLVVAAARKTKRRRDKNTTVWYLCLLIA